MRTLFSSSSPLFVVVLLTSAGAVCLAACSDDSSGAPCPEGTFRCLDTCLPFGSVCGPGDDGGRTDGRIDTDGAVADGGIDTDGGSSDRCMSTDAIPVSRICQGNVAHDCRAGGSDLECDGTDHCEEYVSLDGTEHLASCFWEDEDPCDPSVEPAAACDGSIVTRCGGSSVAIGTRSTYDCRASLGWDDATCVVEDDDVRCIAPEATLCDPETVVEHCDGEQLVTCRGTRDGGEWVRASCASGERCFDSRTDDGGVCLPRSATPESGGPYPLYFNERCTDLTTVRSHSAGYVYDYDCPLETQFTDTGEVTYQSICVIDGFGGGGCVNPDGVATCAASTPPECVTSMGTPASRQCVAQGDGRRILVDAPCIVYPPDRSTGLVTSCAPATGQCTNSGPCAPADPPACLGTFRIACDPTTNYWTLLGSCAP